MIPASIWPQLRLSTPSQFSLWLGPHSRFRMRKTKTSVKRSNRKSRGPAGSAGSAEPSAQNIGELNPGNWRSFCWIQIINFLNQFLAQVDRRLLQQPQERLVGPSQHRSPAHPPPEVRGRSVTSSGPGPRGHQRSRQRPAAQEQPPLSQGVKWGPDSRHGQPKPGLHPAADAVGAVRGPRSHPHARGQG